RDDRDAGLRRGGGRRPTRTRRRAADPDSRRGHPSPAFGRDRSPWRRHHDGVLDRVHRPCDPLRCRLRRPVPPPGWCREDRGGRRGVGRRVARRRHPGGRGGTGRAPGGCRHGPRPSGCARPAPCPRRRGIGHNGAVTVDEHSLPGLPRPRDRYLNRELSWLDFNARVLALAGEKTLPLLERAKYLAIFASNLDEFYMVRVAGLKRRDKTGLSVRSADGQTPAEQLDRISLRSRELCDEQSRLFNDEIRPELEANGIRFLPWSVLTSDERFEMSELFRNQIFPVLTPLAVDPAHPFPYISGLSLNLAVIIRNTDSGQEHF